MNITSKYFFLDGSLVNHHRLTNVDLHVTQFEKDTDNSPFFGEDYFNASQRKWETRFDNSYPNVIYDDEEEIFRLYYTLFLKDGHSEQTPLNQRTLLGYRPFSREVGLCYAESKDGIEWSKPNLNSVSFDGSKNNNIIARKAHGTGVFLDPAETDRSRRYKMVTKMDFGTQLDYMAVAFSEDGVHWSTPQPWVDHNPRADTHNFPFRDPVTGSFVMITRTWNNGIRVVSICESEDFIHWSKPREIARGIDSGSQIYAMPVFTHADLYFGLAAMYHDGDTTLPNHDTVDLELMYATTLDHFDFVDFGHPIIPRGRGTYPQSDFDAGCIFASSPVKAGDSVWCYYMGGNGLHTQFRETSFARAKVDLDRLASYAQRHPNSPGTLATNRLFTTGPQIKLLADVDNGNVHYRLLNATTLDVIDGFDYSDCTPIRKSGWNKIEFSDKDLGAFKEPFCIEFNFHDAKLFALSGDILLHRKS
ncbi:MAG: hypothetical protein Q4P71_01600 [Actinomycetaceae bacterium]|nr:hypothetical protein [Actinomycetaceae bacterium]